jgi:hypothetical protein
VAKKAIKANSVLFLVKDKQFEKHKLMKLPIEIAVVLLWYLKQVKRVQLLL